MLLGYAWLALPTLAMGAVWIFLQSSRLIEVGPTGIPYPVYVLCGMVLWQLFLDALNAPLEQLRASTALLTRTPILIEALLAVAVLRVVANAAVRLAIVAATLFLFRIDLGPELLLAPLGIAALLLFGLGLGLLLAPFGLLYEDVPRATAMAAGLWFFLTPIVYRAPATGIIQHNPLTPLVEFTRHWVTGGASGAAASGEAFAAVAAASLPLCLLGLIVLRLARPHLVERLG